MKIVSVLLTDRVLLVVSGSVVLGDTSMLKDDTDTEEDNSLLTGTTTLVDVNNDVLENSTVSRGLIVEDISIVLDGSMLIDSNSVDVNDIINLREDVVLIGNVALRGSVMLEIIFAKLVALLEIIVDVITLLNDITVFIADCGISVILVDNVVWKLVDVNIIEVVELIILNDGDTSLADMQVSFKPIQFPLARLKVHSVTCLLVWPPNINPSSLTLASELHNK